MPALAHDKVLIQTLRSTTSAENILHVLKTCYILHVISTRVRLRSDYKNGDFFYGTECTFA